MTGCTHSTSGDVIPWHNDDANWKTGVYYDYAGNLIQVYNISSSNIDKFYEILIITT